MSDNTENKNKTRPINKRWSDEPAELEGLNSGPESWRWDVWSNTPQEEENDEKQEKNPKKRAIKYAFVAISVFCWFHMAFHREFSTSFEFINVLMFVIGCWGTIILMRMMFNDFLVDFLVKHDLNEYVEKKVSNITEKTMPSKEEQRETKERLKKLKDK